MNSGIWDELLRNSNFAMSNEDVIEVIWKMCYNNHTMSGEGTDAEK